MATALKPSASKPLPPPNSDFYDIEATLNADELAILDKVRAFMDTGVAPIINDYWVRDAFPFELIEPLKALGIGDIGIGRGGSPMLNGLLIMEMTRVDPSFSTFFGVHTGLAMGSIALLGSEEQKAKWLPPMEQMEKIGCFALTEPLVGSGTGGGLLTTAKRDGDSWILNGEKKWIGNATWCDVSVVWARDVDDNQVKGFIVENKTTPGFSVEKIENKMALKVVQNGHITMTDCHAVRGRPNHNAAVRSARRHHRRTDAPLAKPQAGRRACADVLSRRPAKICEPRALRGPPCKRATSGGACRRQCALI